MPVNHNNDPPDVVRDERSNRTNGPVDENVIRGHRADMWLGTGIHMPASFANGPKRHKHRQSRPHKRHKRLPPVEPVDDNEKKRLALAPGQRVQFLLNQDDEHSQEVETKRIFTEMVELNGTEGQQEWRETARWVKFEEDVEEGGNRWSKPHVATLSLHSLFELRSCLLTGAVVLDLEASDFSQVVDILLDKLIASKLIPDETRDLIRESLLRKHIHQYEHTKAAGKESVGGQGGGGFLSTVRSIADIGRQFSHARNLQQQEVAAAAALDENGHPKASKQLSVPGSSPSTVPSAPQNSQLTLPKVGSIPKDIAREASVADTSKLGNQHFFKKLPPGAEASNVMIGQVEFLENHVSVFIRLKQAALLGDLTEVPVPTRFLFILLGPMGHGTQYREIGRAIATLMCDEVFHDVAYKAHTRSDLLDGVDEFLDQVTVLPPGEWDPNIRIEPPSVIPSQDKRKALAKLEKEPGDEEDEEGAIVVAVAPAGGHGMDPCLKRTGRLFGGLVADVKRKLPFYWSDYKDALNLQCLAAFMFMFFAMLAPIVTFGGLLEEATDKRMAAIENLLSGAICGSLYCLFSGQPLTMIGSTGPVLVFEKIIFKMCQNQWDYLAFRWWINLWSFVILVLIVATDASALVSYITRFTEENFSVLISFIFIYESIAKTIKILDSAHVVPFSPELRPSPYCGCFPKGYDAKNGLNGLAYFNDETNYTVVDEIAHRRKWKMLDNWLYKDPLTNSTILNYAHIPPSYCTAANATLYNPNNQCYQMSDVFLMSLILMLGTFTLAYTLKMMKTSCYFPNKIRELLSDFAVIIALSTMVFIDYIIGLDTPKLFVPEKFEPTWSTGRGWVIDPFHGNPLYSAVVAIAPALLLCILLFMDHDITIVIVNRKENKLKKSAGYHLDLLIVAVGVLISGVFGLPIFVAATVMSISHVNALRVESECRAPGEKPTFVGVREQRVTGLLVFLFIGISVQLTTILKFIPMPVLYGVFLYMGVSSLRGVQMIDRLMLILIPMKYQPDYVYLRHVPINRVHLFTLCQVGCFVVLCVVKEIEITSIVFPIMLVVMVGVRKLMEYMFSTHELKCLDDPMPEITLRKKEDAKKKKELAKQEEEDNQVEQLAKLGTVKTEANLHIKLASGNVMKIPLSSIGERPADEESGANSPQIPSKESGLKNHNYPPAKASQPQLINISEEVNKSGLWQHIASEASLSSKDKESQKKNSLTGSGGNGSKKMTSSVAYQKQATPTGPGRSPLAATDDFPKVDDDDEEEDDTDAITIKIERATPQPQNNNNGGNGMGVSETQPLLNARSEEEKRESAV